MMRIFTDDGDAVPVTVLDVSNNRVTQIKTVETDGYAAVQVTYGKRRASRVSPSPRPALRQGGCRGRAVMLKRIPVAAERSPASSSRARSSRRTSVRRRPEGRRVGHTIGKGFAGVIKRHNFSSNRASHGNSRSHNVPGSIGMAQDPGRVFPGKRMSGHLGNVSRTVQNLEIARVDAERGLLLVKGAVPGAKNGGAIVVVRRPSREAAAKGGERDDGTEAPERAGAGASPRSMRRTRCSVATSTSRWSTRSSSPTRPTRAAARARRRPRRGRHSRQEAVAPEGHRPRPRRHDLQPAVARRRPDLPELARRELHAEGQPQDVPRGHVLDPVAAGPRGAARGGRSSRSLDAPKTKLLAAKLKAMGLDSVLVITDQRRREPVPRVAQPAQRAGARGAPRRPGVAWCVSNVLLTPAGAWQVSRRCWHDAPRTKKY
jgi:large subunit ribosomal protein L3